MSQTPKVPSEKEKLALLQNYIYSFERNFPTKPKEAILILGCSGDGKSILLNYLAGTPLNSIINDSSFGKNIIEPEKDKALPGTEKVTGSKS